MSAAEATIAGAACCVTRSGYTGEDGFELSVAAGGRRPRWPRRCWPSRRWRRSASARAIRCASKPASASMATISTRRRPRSRPALPGRSPKIAAKRATFPVRRRFCANSQTGRAGSASASAPTAAPRRVTAPRFSIPRAIRSAERHQRRVRPLARRAHRDGLCRRCPCRRRQRARPRRPRCAPAGACRAAAVRSDPLLPRLTR